MHTLEAKGISKYYGKRHVVKGLTFHVGTGEIVGLLGPNGAGKTTTFYMIVGLIKPDDPLGIEAIRTQVLVKLNTCFKEAENHCVVTDNGSLRIIANLLIIFWKLPKKVMF